VAFGQEELLKPRLRQWQANDVTIGWYVYSVASRRVSGRSDIVSREDLKKAARKGQSFSEQQSEQVQDGYNSPKTKKRVVALKAATL